MLKSEMDPHMFHKKYAFYVLQNYIFKGECYKELRPSIDQSLISYSCYLMFELKKHWHKRYNVRPNYKG
jgi:hypothetical protein